VEIGTRCAKASKSDTRRGLDEVVSVTRWSRDNATPAETRGCVAAGPGPAGRPSYEVSGCSGCMREEVSARKGYAFDLKASRPRALDVGSVGLDVLSEALLG
jgi:hypothetical protein